MTADTALCDRLEWDSAFFGLAMARARSSRPDGPTARAIRAWCLAERIDCVYVLADADDTRCHGHLRGTGYTLVDERVTLAADVGPTPARPPVAIRQARPSDVPALRAIAGVSHHESRFYADRRFARERCDELYRTWIERSCRGGADHVAVAERDGRTVGYVTLVLGDGGTASIGLLAVHPEARRAGIGRALLVGGRAWLADRGVARVTVVTQGRNAASLALYERSGFVVVHRALWYHGWFLGPAPAP